MLSASSLLCFTLLCSALNGGDVSRPALLSAMTVAGQGRQKPDSPLGLAAAAKEPRFFTHVFTLTPHCCL